MKRRNPYWLSTYINPEQRSYYVPQDFCSIVWIEIYNRKKGEWRREKFSLLIEPEKILKTDSQLKLVGKGQ